MSGKLDAVTHAQKQTKTLYNTWQYRRNIDAV